MQSIRFEEFLYTHTFPPYSVFVGFVLVAEIFIKYVQSCRKIGLNSNHASRIPDVRTLRTIQDIEGDTPEL